MQLTKKDSSRKDAKVAAKCAKIIVLTSRIAAAYIKRLQSLRISFAPLRGLHLLIIAFLGLFLIVSFREVVPVLEVQQLRCELRINPEGIDIAKPRLSWEMTGTERGLYQAAYQVLVASSKEKLEAGEGDLWNSGKVSSDQSVHVQYSGVPLRSRTACYWKVKVWTRDAESAWSAPAYWSMGLNANDWQAQWIGLDRAFAWDNADNQFSRLSARYFRKDFNALKTVKRATAYISGLGLYELYVNGHRVGDQVLAPAPTDYTESVLYHTFDVTGHLQQGANTVATILGNGRYFTMRQAYKPYKIHTFGYPKMLLQLEVEYTDGTRETIASDATWKVTADGPIRANNEYDGEEYNATKEMPGWNKPAFDDSAWLAAELVEAPGGKVKAQLNEPMKVMEILKPVAITSPKPGTYIVDMGQNMVGWVKLKVKGKRGDAVTLRFAETLKPDGTLYIANLRDAKVTDIYTLKGEAEEQWEPSFVYHGFRYVEVTGFPGTPTAANFEGRVVYDALATTGTFETSDPVINQVYKNAYWGIRGNYKGMPVDCPQRNERQPWLGDRATGAYGESFIFGNATLYAKWLHDIEQSQTAEGRIPDVAPNFWFYYKDNMTWPGTYLMVADMVYRQFGDTRPIKEHYQSMKQWLVFMENKYMDDYIVNKDNYGDWCVPPESQELIHAKDPARKTDGSLIATAYCHYLLQRMQQFAVVSGNAKDTAAYAALATRIKQAFNTKFYDAQTAQYGNGTVTANLLALRFGLAPEADRQKVFANIVNRITVNDRGHISTGVIGTQWLMRSLTEYGRADIALRMATNRTYPSWGYMADHGATTIWELWNGDTANPEMNSHNHVMLLGDLVVWYYEYLAGIKSSYAHPGFKQIEMKPSVIAGLDYVKATYHSVHGLVKSHWTKKGKTFTWRVTVPGNTMATIYVPAKTVAQVKEGGKKIAAVKGVRLLRMENDGAVFEVGSGDYVFTSSLSN